MTFAKKMTLVLGFVATSFLASSAQEVSARVTLQHPTSFEGTVLPAGEYKLQTRNSGTLLALITSTSDMKSVMLVPKQREYAATCKSTSLSLVSSNGEWAAQSLCLAENDVTLYFSALSKKTTVTTAALAGSH